MGLQKRLLGLPYPLWTLFSCKPFSPWCLVDDVLHWAYPLTFGFTSERVSFYPPDEPWCCRMHSRSVDRYWRRVTRKIDLNLND